MMENRTRIQRKRQMISTSYVDPIKRRRSSLTDKPKDFKIILRKLSPDEFRSNPATMSCSHDEYRSVCWTEPSVSIPRVDIATRKNENNRFENVGIGSNICKNMDAKCSEFSTAKRTTRTVDFHRHESIITRNIISERTKSFHTPIPEHNDKVIEEERESSKHDVDFDRREQQILRDVKNVVKSNYISLRKHGKNDTAVLSLLRGQENILLKKSKGKIRKEERLIDYETPLLKRLSQKSRESANAKLFSNRKRMSTRKNVSHCQPQSVKKESVETMSKTGKLVHFSLKEIQKDTKVQKTRSVAVRSCKSDFHRNNTELTKESRELYDESVVSLSLLEQPEQSASRRERTRNLACVTNIKNRGFSKKVIVNFNNDLEPQLTTSLSEKSQKTEQKRDFNDSLEFDDRSKSQLVRRQSRSSPKSEKKKLNVSFKEGVDIIDERPVESSLRNTMQMKNNTPTTDTPCKFGEKVISVKQDEENEMPFYGFPAPVGPSPHTGFCSFVLNSVSSCLKKKSKKRMTRKEAEEKSKIVDICKKTLENCQRPGRSCQRLALKRMKQKLTVESTVVEYECLKMPTSYVRLNRLNPADISSYKITPLREERMPIKSKTKYDYGIDDVYTDDSTDDEDDPKKIVPEWASLAKKTLKTFNPHEKIPRQTIRVWMKPPRLDGVALRRHLFSKCRKR